MKKVILLFICVLVSSLAAQEMPKHKGSRALEKIKALSGTWEGEMDHGEGPKKIQVIYRVTGGGSAVVETLFPGSPMEMVTMYHDLKDTLVMTHYCMLGNQPQMRLTKSSDKQVSMELMEKSTITKNEAHMHALTIDFVDDDHIKHTWTSYREGKAEKDVVFELSREK